MDDAREVLLWPLPRSERGVGEILGTAHTFSASLKKILTADFLPDLEASLAVTFFALVGVFACKVEIGLAIRTEWVPAWATKISGTFAPVFLLAFEATFFICTFFSAFKATAFLVGVFAFALVFVRVFFATISSKKAEQKASPFFDPDPNPIGSDRIRIRSGSDPRQ